MFWSQFTIEKVEFLKEFLPTAYENIAAIMASAKTKRERQREKYAHLTDEELKQLVDKALEGIRKGQGLLGKSHWMMKEDNGPDRR